MRRSATNSSIAFTSVEYGTDQFVRVTQLTGSGPFPTVDMNGNSVIEDTGADAVGIVNGTRSTGRGLDLVMNTTLLEMSVRVDENFTSGDYVVLHHGRWGAVPTRTGRQPEPAGQHGRAVGSRLAAG